MKLTRLEESVLDYITKQKVASDVEIYRQVTGSEGALRRARLSLFRRGLIELASESNQVRTWRASPNQRTPLSAIVVKDHHAERVSAKKISEAEKEIDEKVEKLEPKPIKGPLMF